MRDDFRPNRVGLSGCMEVGKEECRPEAAYVPTRVGGLSSFVTFYLFLYGLLVRGCPYLKVGIADSNDDMSIASGRPTSIDSNCP